jgi:hypothetical protein
MTTHGINFVEKLNDTFFELLNDLIRIFPDNPDFHIYLVASRAALALDETFMFFIFKQKVIQYEKQILAKDEQFMISMDVASQLETSTARVKEHLIIVIHKLRELWSHISHENKEVIWRYFKTMILIYHKIEAIDGI